MKARFWVAEYPPPVYPDQGLPPLSPGQPEHPWVPPGNYPDQGLPPLSPGTPEHPWVPPQPGYPDQGLPPISPGVPAHPIELPPDGTIGGTPEHPIYYPPVAPGVPAHPIELPPDGTIGGTPEHPIYYPPGTPEHPWVPPTGGAPGYPTHPIVLPGQPDQGLPPTVPFPIVIAGDDMEGHPDLPDLNGPGGWGSVQDANGLVFPAFIMSPVQDAPEDAEPQEPEDGLPGSWVTVIVVNMLAWAWIPSPANTDPPHPEQQKSKK